MSFMLNVPTVNGSQTSIEINVGETIFVVGANGTGKSSLMQRLASSSGGTARRISASRQTWLQSSALEFSPSQKAAYEQQTRQWDNHHESRFKEQNAQLRSGLTLYDLIDAENVDARAIANAMRAGNIKDAETLARKTAPIAKINELLAFSGIPVIISVEGGDKLVASKNGSPTYGAAELSDGERNALLIAADVLTSKPGTLLIIDEPERHLHRSIISPLLSQLFRYRSDCAFIVATHDLALPVDNPDSRVMLIRSCSYSGNYAQYWDFDILSANVDLDEQIKQDIVGSRRKIVFIEGDDDSLDKPLYSILFPNVSVRSKGSSKDVESSVAGIRSSESVHWVKAWGIIDNDGRDLVSIASLQSNGVFALPFYSVESIYYHEAFISAVSVRYASVTGSDGAQSAKLAVTEAIRVATPHFSRLSARSVEKTIRRIIFSQLPTLKEIEKRNSLNVIVDTKTIVEAEVAALEAARASGDWLRILTRCPIRETPALDTIARTIGFQDRFQYEAAVLQMLRDDESMRLAARAFFGSLPAELED